MNVSNLPSPCLLVDHIFELSLYVFELRVNAIMLVGSVSRMMTLESANMCSDADLILTLAYELDHLIYTHNGYSSGVRSAARNAHNPLSDFSRLDFSFAVLVSISEVCEAETAPKVSSAVVVSVWTCGVAG